MVPAAGLEPALPGGNGFPIRHPWRRDETGASRFLLDGREGLTAKGRGETRYAEISWTGQTVADSTTDPAMRTDARIS